MDARTIHILTIRQRQPELLFPASARSVSMMTIRQEQIDRMEAATGQSAVMPCRTWIEIRLLDDNDKVVADAAYRVKLPDGSIREGKLNENGSARFEDIRHGVCVVTFPELDEEAWNFESSDSGAAD